MRVVILSDIHANLPALEGVLADLRGVEVDRFVCLGDIVGYYAQPQECVDRLRELGAICVQGNHDAVAGGVEEPLDFNDIAAAAILWTRGQLRPESRAWLAALPAQVEFAPGWLAVHGSLRDRDEYLFSQPAIQANFALLEQADGLRAAFFGHTHRRAAYVELGRQVAMIAEETLPLTDELRYLINPGGTGQPRDGSPAAPYVLLEDRVVQFRRAVYNVEEAAARAAALPFGALLAERLRRGG